MGALGREGHLSRDLKEKGEKTVLTGDMSSRQAEEIARAAAMR